jgi:signal transduction histidine kinase
MAPAPEDAASDLAAAVLKVVDAHRGDAFCVTADLPPLPPVAAPEDLLEAVIETLVENSRQAGARTVRIAAREEGERVRLTLADDGPGIPPADHERIFEPFHTTRRSEGGSGLGLAIARSLLDACGGTIRSIATTAGAEFELCLPVASPGATGAIRTRG